MSEHLAGLGKLSGWASACRGREAVAWNVLAQGLQCVVWWNTNGPGTQKTPEAGLDQLFPAACA